MNVTIYSNQRPTILDDFVDAYHYRNLCYYASDLASIGLNHADDICNAVGRALKGCKTLGIPASQHIRNVYLFRDGTVYTDWLLSPTGLKLVLLNADPVNEIVARIQLRLING